MLREEKSIRMPGGLYHELQVRMTYNSNHIEGSRLSEDQTRRSFETNTIEAGKEIPVVISSKPSIISAPLTFVLMWRKRRSRRRSSKNCIVF